MAWRCRRTKISCWSTRRIAFASCATGSRATGPDRAKYSSTILPGYPDNITSNRQGTFWLALFTVRNDEADWLSPRPFLKGVLAKMPAFMWPKPQPYAFVVKLDEHGHILDTLQDPTGKNLHEVTSAFERDGHLYLGSLHNDRIGKYKLP